MANPRAGEFRILHGSLLYWKLNMEAEALELLHVLE